MLRLVAFVLPLGLDTFGVAAAVGVAGVDGRRRLRLSILFAMFEGAMPLVGLGLGAGAGRAVGVYADYAAGVVLLGLGGYLLWPGGDEEGARAAELAHARGVALLALGVSVSLDELAIGFSAGLIGLPVVPAVVLIAVQAFVVAQVGIRVGARVGERVREGAERLAGVALVMLGAGVILARIL